eukprot:IDg12974t1
MKSGIAHGQSHIVSAPAHKVLAKATYPRQGAQGTRSHSTSMSTALLSVMPNRAQCAQCSATLHYKTVALSNSSL